MVGAIVLSAFWILSTLCIKEGHVKGHVPFLLFRQFVLSSKVSLRGGCGLGDSTCTLKGTNVSGHILFKSFLRKAIFVLEQRNASAECQWAGSVQGDLSCGACWAPLLEARTYACGHTLCRQCSARTNTIDKCPSSACDFVLFDVDDPACAASHGPAIDLAEKLVDLEYHFQLWRFGHLKTVERVIGYKVGTGGTAGVSYLARVIEQKFFPELISVRTAL